MLTFLETFFLLSTVLNYYSLFCLGLYEPEWFAGNLLVDSNIYAVSFQQSCRILSTVQYMYVSALPFIWLLGNLEIDVSGA